MIAHIMPEPAHIRIQPLHFRNVAAHLLHLCRKKHALLILLLFLFPLPKHIHNDQNRNVTDKAV